MNGSMRERQDAWQEVLRRSTAESWCPYLKVLASSNSFPFFHVASRLVAVKDGGDYDGILTSSWEKLLASLAQNTATVQGGQLKVLPLFLTLPSHLQARVLFILLQQEESVSAVAISDFVDQVSEYCSNGSWTEHLLRKLSSKFCQIDRQEQNSLSGPRPYEFCDQSKSQLTDVLGKVWSRSERQNTATVTTCGSFDGTTGGTRGEGPSAGQDQDQLSLSRSENKNNSSSDNVVDVIIIDDDGDKDEENSDDIMISSQPIREENCDNFENPVKMSKKRVLADVVNDDDGNDNGDSERMHKKVKCEKPLALETAIKTSNVNEYENSRVPSSSGKDETSDTRTENSAYDDGNAGKILSRHEEDYSLSESEMSFLGPFREFLSSKDSQDPAVFSPLWSHLQNCTSEQVLAACDFLKMQDLSEEKIVCLCDSLPWINLGYNTSLIIIQAFLKDKVMKLSSQPSHTLVAAAKSVAKFQARVLLEALIDFISETCSGLPQCQLLISLCEDCLTEECASFLLRQVSLKTVKMNEHLSSVLQALVDRRPDLEPEGLQNFVHLLGEASAECCSSPKLGKLLLSFTNKYGKKLTDDQMMSLSALIGENKSSLKRALTAALKRLAR